MYSSLLACRKRTRLPGIRESYPASLGRIRRLGLTSVEEDLSPEGWSGVPAGLARGLRHHGWEPVPASSQLAPPLGRAALGASALLRRGSGLAGYHSHEQEALRSALAVRRLRRAGALENVVLLGAELHLPPGTRYVSLLDMTLAQAGSVHPDFRRLDPRVVTAGNVRQRRVYAAARGCCAASHWTARSLTTDYGIDPARVHVVGFGRNQEPPPHCGEWRAPRFLFIGREWQRKNGPGVLRAFARLREGCPDATLEVVGGHPPLSEPGVRGHGPLALHRPDDRRRAGELLARTTCFVMPSEAEPFGIVYAEAAAAGVPSIATSVGGAGTIVGERGGVLVDPGDEAALLRAMLRLSDPCTARAMGDAARERSRLFTWEAVAGRVLRALRPPGLVADGLPEFL